MPFEQRLDLLIVNRVRCRRIRREPRCAGKEENQHACWLLRIHQKSIPIAYFIQSAGVAGLARVQPSLFGFV
jgi:hypothetical protein